jgi:hypothetical protein
MLNLSAMPASSIDHESNQSKNWLDHKGQWLLDRFRNDDYSGMHQSSFSENEGIDQKSEINS